MEMERTLEDLRGSLGNSEKRRIALTSELEDCRSALENSERGRKGAEAERDEATSRVSELNIHITSLSNEKRRLEGDNTGLLAELEEARAGEVRSFVTAGLTTVSNALVAKFCSELNVNDRTA